jgi:hypothetical protein
VRATQLERVRILPGLIERSRVRSPYSPFGLPEWFAKRLAPFGHAVMVRKHLLGIARRAERRS